MKVLTNFKDYYDHISWKYGIDEKIIFNRVKSTTKDDIPNPNKSEVYPIAFCWKIYIMLYHKWKFYYWEDIKNFAESLGYNYKSKISKPYPAELDELKNKANGIDFYREFFLKEALLDDRKPTNINEEYNNPAVLLHIKQTYWNDRFDVWSSEIALEDYSFHKIFTPEEAYLAISNFLTREKEIKNNMSDLEKVNSHGFNTKTSFRPKMKK